MKVSPNIFRAYDIRGIYPEEINEKIACEFGQVFVSFIKKRRKFKKIDILVGQDNRISSPLLFKGLSEGIRKSGANVISVGVCTTPMFYFASKHYHFDDGGLMITASHLPREYNGFKVIRDFPIPIDEKTGLLEIKKMIEKDDFKPAKKRGKISKKNILNKYVDYCLKDFNLKEIKPLRIVIDTGNNPTGIIIPSFFKKTKCKIFHLFSKLDGKYPNRSPDYLKKGMLDALRREILKKKADLGVAFDGDGDRMIYLDEKGKIITPDIICAFLAEILLKENPGSKIIYTVGASRIIPETIEKNGGIPVVSAVGHSNIKRRMRKENILFGGEVSGHYYYKKHYFSEAPFFVLLKTIENISRTGENISKLVLPFEKYISSGEMNFKVKNPEKVLKKIEKKFSKTGKILKIDGIRIDFKTWWFLLRPSRTEPILRLLVEAETKKLMTKKKKALVDFIRSQPGY